MSISQYFLQETIGKTISGFVIMRGESPKYQIHIVFSDNTTFEIWGEDVSVSRLSEGNIDQVEEYAKKFGATTRVE